MIKAKKILIIFCIVVSIISITLLQKQQEVIVKIDHYNLETPTKTKEYTVDEINISESNYSDDHRNKILASRGEYRKKIYTITAYDLSVQSCGKPIGSNGYGKTATGYSLEGHKWHTARSIAVDPNVIPLGSKVFINFLDECFKSYNGIYTARDTGGGITGNNIDLFLGDFNSNYASKEAIAFGVRKAEIIILE